MVICARVVPCPFAKHLRNCAFVHIIAFCHGRTYGMCENFHPGALLNEKLTARANLLFAIPVIFAVMSIAQNVSTDCFLAARSSGTDLDGLKRQIELVCRPKRICGAALFLCL